MLLKKALTIIAVVILGLHLAEASDFRYADTTVVGKNEIEKNHLQSIDSLSLIHAGQELARKNFEHLLTSQLSTSIKKILETGTNDYIQNYIDRFTKRDYRSHLAKMMGLSAYYFPIFESIFKETGVPSELKYLAIIESSLNPHAVSRVGATGPWQFMYTTAKAYGLKMDSYVDERKDPIAASYAASTFLKESYAIYNDWFLAIASYNCGRGNVDRAIQRSSKAAPNFWDIRPYLPKETRNYVPAFIAIYRVLERCESYGIIPSYTPLNTDTELIMVTRNVSLKSIANALDIGVDTLALLNPSYKRGVINGSINDPERLVVPPIERTSYVKLYHLLENGDKLQTVGVMNASTASKAIPNVHRVRKGETLEEIAKHYDVTVQDLKVWNHLRTNTIVPEQKLKINNAGEAVPTKASQYITYKVKKGDTLIGISKQFRGSSVSSIKAMNELKSNLLKPGMTLRINQL